MQRARFPPLLAAAALLLCAVPLVRAHGHGAHEDVAAASSQTPNNGTRTSNVSTLSGSSSIDPQSYFSLPAHKGAIYSHIALMTLAWVLVLPFAITLSITRSRLKLPFQTIFLTINALGILMGTVYNAQTPDLYPNNLHHKLGWAVTWIFSAHAFIGLVNMYIDQPSEHTGREDEQTSFLPVSIEAMAEHQRLHAVSDTNNRGVYDLPRDSGQGTERASTSLASQPVSPFETGEERRHDFPDRYNDLDIYESEKRPLEPASAMGQFIHRRLRGVLSKRAFRALNLLGQTVDRTFLILGFVTLASGLVTYGGIFQGKSIFNGLAHFIKGGIFFWYGLLTLGRWMGCFAELGWAWNLKPSASSVGRRKASMPSAEFVESFLIFLYGCTNVFLEHLAAWGSVWTAQDLEHVSITIMFFGGGLCGMLVESSLIRDLLNTTIHLLPSQRQLPVGGRPGVHNSLSQLEPPRSYPFSLNPMPSLVVCLLGFMMSSHHQNSMVSTMVHKQWGTLLIGAALARAVTYLLIYLAPPTSLLPSRPPSELVCSFCLVAGGLIFMASNRNTVAAMEHYGLDAMFVFTVTMGITAFIMSWMLVVFAVKGLAVRRKSA